MIKECLLKVKEGQAKVVEANSRYFDNVCNALPDYVVDEMLEQLEVEALSYGYYKPLEEPVKIRDWLLLHTARDGYNLANKDQYKLYRFYEDGEEMFAIAGYYGAFIYDKHFNYIKSYRGQTVLRTVLVDIEKDIMLVAKDFKIEAVRYSTLEHLWEFGNNSRGELGDGKLNYVRQLSKLPNGNYAVSQLYGKGYDVENDVYLTSKSEGVVFELDTNGKLVQTLLYRGDNSYYPEEGYIRNPKSIRIVNNKLYVSTYLNQVAVFELDENNKATYTTTYTPPPEFGITFDLAISDFCIYGNQLIVISEALKQVIGFDLENRNIIWAAGEASVENLATTPPKLNGIYAPKGVIVRNEDGAIIVSDDFNDMVKIIYPNPYKVVEYDIPETEEILYSSLPHIENNKFKTKIDNYPDLFLLYRKGQSAD